jgi:hypothetical protein
MVNVGDMPRFAYPTGPLDPSSDLFLQNDVILWPVLASPLSRRPGAFNCFHNSAYEIRRVLIKYTWQIAVNDVTCVCSGSGWRGIPSYSEIYHFVAKQPKNQASQYCTISL